MAKISFVTLGVDDLERSLRFYRSWLGLNDDAVRRGEDQAALEMEDGFSLVLYPRAEIAKTAGMTAGMPSASEFILSRAADSRETLDRWLDEGVASGGTIPTPPTGGEWGLSGFLLDPDGHLWEIVWFADGA